MNSLRADIVGAASGRVLEIGAGYGENLRYYQYSTISELTLSDVDLYELTIRRKLRSTLPTHPRVAQPAVNFVECNAEALPFPENTFDSVVVSLVLCSVSSPQRALSEIGRVLSPRGKLCFVEHVVAKSPALATLFRRLTPAWHRWADNCHLDRQTLETMATTGFAIDRIRSRFNGILVGGIAHIS